MTVSESGSNSDWTEEGDPSFLDGLNFGDDFLHHSPLMELQHDGQAHHQPTCFDLQQQQQQQQQHSSHVHYQHQQTHESVLPLSAEPFSSSTFAGDDMALLDALDQPANLAAQKCGDNEPASPNSPLPEPELESPLAAKKPQRKSRRSKARLGQNPAPRKLTSRFRGVCWYKRTKRWVVQLKIAGIRKHVGYFKDELKAARAYEEALREIQIPLGLAPPTSA